MWNKPKRLLRLLLEWSLRVGDVLDGLREFLAEELELEFGVVGRCHLMMERARGPKKIDDDVYAKRGWRPPEHFPQVRGDLPKSDTKGM